MQKIRRPQLTVRAAVSLVSPDTIHAGAPDLKLAGDEVDDA